MFKEKSQNLLKEKNNKLVNCNRIERDIILESHSMELTKEVCIDWLITIELILIALFSSMRCVDDSQDLTYVPDNDHCKIFISIIRYTLNARTLQFQVACLLFIVYL